MRSVSQPFSGRASQSPRFGSQLPMRQVRVEQSPMAPAGAHERPQAPQSVSESREVSQPSAGFMLQSAKPAVQVPMRQVPPAQSPVAFAGAQTDPQAPHEDVVESEVSQPLVSSASQSPKPGSHSAMAQLPLTHAAAATCSPRGHIVAGSPSSTVPLQSLSAPSQASVELAWVSGSPSSQSRPRQPTPSPCRSPSSSTQQRSPTGAHTGMGIESLKLVTQSKRAGQSGRSMLQAGRQTCPPTPISAQ